MAELLAPNDLVTIEDLALSSMWEVAAGKATMGRGSPVTDARAGPRVLSIKPPYLSRVQDNITITKEESHGVEDLCRWLAVFGDQLAVE